MVKKKKEVNRVIMERHGNYMRSEEGKYYKPSHIDGRFCFVEVPKKEVNKMMKQADKLAEHLKDNLDKIKVLKEALLHMTPEDLDKLYKMIFKSKRKYKPRTREGHCVDMKVGNFIIPLVG